MNLIQSNDVFAVLKSCESQVAGNCQAQTVQFKKATCECVENTRAELKKRLASIAQAIKDVCFIIIHNKLIHLSKSRLIIY